MRVREWAGADYYGELGVPTTATRDEITAAYRARARVLHPDTGPTDPQAEARFVRAATAYRVLTGPLREEYDRARRRGAIGSPTTTVARPGRGGPAPATPRPFRVTRTGARWALWGGLALVVAGLLTAGVVLDLQVRDSRLRHQGIPVEAQVVRTAHGVELEFTTRSGSVVHTGVPDEKSGRLAAGDTVAVRYDRSDPAHVVTAQGNLTRDITLWIVAAKFLIVGAILAVVGGRRLLRPEPDGE